MKFFIDTHDAAKETFPPGLTPVQFDGFFAQYEEACAEEEVVILRVHVAYEAGRAFCFTMAPNADCVRRAHERVSLPFDSICEVKTATPGDTFFRPHAA
ncbi:hypothetical protein GGD81_004444 [Rhodobium orientis]|nr:nickel-binding protein [Rhodobium orientis]MBB4305368.1 hypothetical protein [Rhodobium orientis]